MLPESRRSSDRSPGNARKEHCLRVKGLRQLSSYFAGYKSCASKDPQIKKIQIQKEIKCVNIYFFQNLKAFLHPEMVVADRFMPISTLKYRNNFSRGVEPMSVNNIRAPIVAGIAFLLGMSVVPSYGAPSDGERTQLAFLHTLLHDQGAHHETRHGTHHGHHGHRGNGCFVTTTPQNHARGIRHWVSPCPHRELKHMNPYHPPHHKMRYNPHTKSHHRIDD